MRPFLAIDAEIATRAARQYGVVTRAQLLELGLGESAIARRLRAGRFHRLHSGVYAVGHTAPRREARWLAAVLACGDGAVLGIRSGGWLWGIREAEGRQPDVIPLLQGHRSHPGIRIHRMKLQPQDRTIHKGIPVTTPSRTLVDLAHVLEDRDLVRAVRETQFRRLFDLEATREALTHRNSKRLRELIEDYVDTRTTIEDDLIAICDRHRLPRPETQQQLLGRRVDFLWPAERLIVEADGWEAHRTPAAFQQDREATNTFQLHGYTTLRFTHTDLRRRSRSVAAQIRAALRTWRRAS